MSADNGLAIRPVVRQEVSVHHSEADFQQACIPRRAVLGHGSLNEVPEIVELVAARLSLGRHAQRRALRYVICVEITRGFLRGFQQPGNAIDMRREEFGVLSRAGLVSNLSPTRGLRPLINVGVGVDRARLWRGALPPQTAEVGHAAMLLQQSMHAWQALLNVGTSALLPESPVNGDRAYGNRPQSGVRRVRKVDDALVLPVRGAKFHLRLCLRSTQTAGRESAEGAVGQ